jgi:hypothetical protein
MNERKRGDGRSNNPEKACTCGHIFAPFSVF